MIYHFFQFGTLKYTIGLRITEEEEKLGLDRVDHDIFHQSYDGYIIEYNRLIGRRMQQEFTELEQPAAVVMSNGKINFV